MAGDFYETIPVLDNFADAVRAEFDGAGGGYTMAAKAMKARRDGLAPAA